MSGRVTFSISYAVFCLKKKTTVASLVWSMVPIAPSATTTRSARTARSVLIAPHFRQLLRRLLASPQSPPYLLPKPTPWSTLPRAGHARGHTTSRANHVVLRETTCTVLGGG